MEYFCVFCGKKLDRQKRKYCNNLCKCKNFYKEHPEKCNIWSKNNPKPKVKNKCKVCGKDCGRKFYCSNKCKDFAYYFNDKQYWKTLERIRAYQKTEKSKIRNKKWIKENKKDYLLKSKSRNLTRRMLNRQQIIFPLKCHECGSFLKLEIHHEIYPQTKEEIKEAVKNKKIYLLCKFCHSNIYRND